MLFSVSCVDERLLDVDEELHQQAPGLSKEDDSAPQCLFSPYRRHLPCHHSSCLDDKEKFVRSGSLFTEAEPSFLELCWVTNLGGSLSMEWVQES